MFMAALNMISALVMIIYFLLRVVRHSLSYKIYLGNLYINICVLFIVKGLFYLGALS